MVTNLEISRWKVDFAQQIIHMNADVNHEGFK